MRLLIIIMCYTFKKLKKIFFLVSYIRAVLDEFVYVKKNFVLVSCLDPSVSPCRFFSTIITRKLFNRLSRNFCSKCRLDHIWSHFNSKAINVILIPAHAHTFLFHETLYSNCICSIFLTIFWCIMIGL